MTGAGEGSRGRKPGGSGPATRRPARSNMVGQVVRILIATCPGCEDLGRALGLPLVRIDAVVDPAAEIHDLNRPAVQDRIPSHWLRLSIPNDPWLGWSEVDVPSNGSTAEEADGREGVIRTGKRLAVVLPREATVADYRLQFQGTLRHLGLRPALDRRVLRISQAQRTDVHAPAQRRTGDEGDSSPSDADKSDRLYVLDPVAGFGALFWMAVGARMAVALPADP